MPSLDSTQCTVYVGHCGNYFRQEFHTKLYEIADFKCIAYEHVRVPWRFTSEDDLYDGLCRLFELSSPRPSKETLVETVKEVLGLTTEDGAAIMEWSLDFALFERC